MKKKKVLVALALVLLVLGIITYWQKSNLQIIIQAGQHTSQELEQQMAENQQALQDVIDNSPDILVRVPTDEEKRALHNGTLTPEELAELLTQTPEGEIPEQEKFRADLSALIARVLALREYYVAALEDMEATAKQEYRELTGEERSKKNLMKVAQRYITDAGRLETECDTQMDEIVDQMTTILKEHDGKMSIVDTVIETYAKEKSLKKSWYLARLKERGLV